MQCSATSSKKGNGGRSDYSLGCGLTMGNDLLALTRTEVLVQFSRMDLVNEINRTVGASWVEEKRAA